MSIKRDIKFRVYLSFSAMLLLALVIVIKVLIIQHKDGDKLRAMAKKVHVRHETVPANRGNIYTENGTLLCSTIPEFDFHVDFGVMNKDTFYYYLDSLSYDLSHLFKDGSARYYRRRLARSFREGYRFWLLKKNASFRQYEALRQFPIFNKSQNRGGLIVTSKPHRINPYGSLARRAIGLWRENAPSVGLEREYDSVLAGRPGTRVIRKTTGGVWMPVKGSEVNPVQGENIVTTLNLGIQSITESALRKVLKKYNCQYGTAIVMEVKTGKIRALANLGRQSDGSYYEDYNYALLATEPGSTFKLYSLLSLLEDGYLTIHDKVNTGTGVRYFGGLTVRDDHAGLGVISVKDALAHSSNVAFATMVDKYYHDDPMKYISHLQDLRLNIKTGIDLPGEKKPFIETPKDKIWNKNSSLAFIGFGYQSKVSPLQTCMVYNAVANNGVMMKPYLVSAIRQYGKTIDSIKPTVLVKKIAKPSTLIQLKKALYAVVNHGTGHRIKSPFYYFGGKTGTSEIAGQGITYADGVRQGTFVGFFPLKHPKYTICVLARSAPHGVGYGASLGAPVFHAIANRLYATDVGQWQMPDSVLNANKIFNRRGLNKSFLPIAKRMGWTTHLSHQNTHLVSIERQQQDGDIEQDNATTIKLDIMPNLIGLGLKDAVSILSNEGLNIKIKGSGSIIAQSVPAGEKVKPGQIIYLTLS